MQNALRCIAYSLFICIFLSWAFVIANERFGEIGFWCACALIVLVGGAIAGVLIGVIRKKGFFRKAMSKVGNNVNLTPSPWDFKFSQINEAKWIKVMLTSGEEIYGLYSNDSDASSVADVGAGIYLEKTCDEDWQYKPLSDGVFIPYNSINMMEFFNEGGDGNETEPE